jgi:hypothetical protein
MSIGMFSPTKQPGTFLGNVYRSRFSVGEAVSFPGGKRRFQRQIGRLGDPSLPAEN